MPGEVLADAQTGERHTQSGFRLGCVKRVQRADAQQRGEFGVGALAVQRLDRLRGQVERLDARFALPRLSRDHRRLCLARRQGHIGHSHLGVSGMSPLLDI
jgi:hypothetical protein